MKNDRKRVYLTFDSFVQLAEIRNPADATILFTNEKGRSGPFACATTFEDADFAETLELLEPDFLLMWNSVRSYVHRFGIIIQIEMDFTMRVESQFATEKFWVCGKDFREISLLLHR
jgi:hypothetical protein